MPHYVGMNDLKVYWREWSKMFDHFTDTNLKDIVDKLVGNGMLRLQRRDGWVRDLPRERRVMLDNSVRDFLPAN